MKSSVYGYIIGAVIVLVVAIIIALVATSLKQLNSDEMGLAYDTVQKKLSDNVEQEGLHSGPPGFVYIKFPSVYRTISYPDLQCLNKDGVIITLNVDYQYQTRTTELKKVIMEFRDHERYAGVLKTVGEAAIHEACSKYNTTEFQTARALFQESVRDKLGERFDALHADVADLQVNNIARPAAYEQAIQEKEAARENIEVARNERPREMIQANTAKRESETAAIILFNKAESDARIIKTRAESEAAAIKKEYEVEAATYAEIMDIQGLGVEGFLAYMGVRTIGAARNTVYAGMKAPAKTSYFNN